MSKTVYLDRDGTINVDTGYAFKIKDLLLIPNAAHAIGRLKRASFSVVVVSNQSAIGRGMASASEVDAFNAELQRRLLQEDEDALIDAVVYSSDHPDNPSDKRKPGIGLLDDLLPELRPSGDNNWMVGDKLSDLQFGINAGFTAERSLLVRTGKGLDTEKSLELKCPVFDSIAEACEHISISAGD